MSSKSTMQNIVVKGLNALALLMVVGCIFYLSSSNNENKVLSADDRLAKFGLVEQDIALPTSNKAGRNLSKGKGKGSDIDCIPLYPTPAPTKGKGKGSRRELSKGGKGKGDDSAAPSFFCSDAPSIAPSTSASPTMTLAPSGAPSLSAAPSCYKGKGKGKGSDMFDEECGKGKGKGSRRE